MIHESFSGSNYYRKGYRQVLLGLKTEEEIMGSSIYQSLIVQALVFYLKTILPKKQYWVPTNEAGLHLSLHENMANDIVIVEKGKLSNPQSERYSNIPPKLVIEVDLKIDPIDYDAEPPTDISMTYVVEKSKKLLDFGVESVIWIMTRKQQIFLTRSQRNLEIYDWSEHVPLFDSFSFCLRDILEDEGILPIDQKE
jgi:Uma2 family endonuclease